MSTLNEVYKCESCGNIVELVHSGGGTLTCCGKPMTLMVENTVEASKEKHIPVIEKLNNQVYVKIGSVEHPMEEKHYIEWIELLFDDKVYRKYLFPGDKPEAYFDVPDINKEFTARELCNIHGLWKA